MYTSLAELVQQLPSKQKYIGSNPIRCFIKLNIKKNKKFCFIKIY